eukprot:9376947-Pyramimonas_sp.AAC.1
MPDLRLFLNSPPVEGHARLPTRPQGSRRERQPGGNTLGVPDPRAPRPDLRDRPSKMAYVFPTDMSTVVH